MLYVLQAQEQRRLVREKGVTEGALLAKLKLNHGYKWKNKKEHDINFDQERSLIKAIMKKMRSQIIIIVNYVERGIILILHVGRGLIYSAKSVTNLVIFQKFAKKIKNAASN